tara:strand:+ start:884 stop:1399 length:516 start_codon:yes stop_codon:yes gene_type:complete
LLKYLRAFTSIEILITLIIVGILTTVGIIGFREVIQNNKAVTTSNALVASFAYARSEAIQQASLVSICPAANSNLLSCASNGNWANGWIIFLDPTNTGTISDTDNILKVHQALELGTQVNSNLTRFTFNASGFLISGVDTVNISASGCTGNNGRQLTLTSTGRTDIVQSAC